MFYTYDQNNSGGGFDFEKDAISHYVIIEADSTEEANARAESVGVYFDPDCEIDCSCCGSRWSEAWGSEADTVPSIYGKDVSSGTLKKGKFHHAWMGENPEGYIHYKDGRVQAVNYV